LVQKGLHRDETVELVIKEGRKEGKMIAGNKEAGPGKEKNMKSLSV
jgi:hypothetical protein